MTNGDPEGWIFLAHPAHTKMDSFSCSPFNITSDDGKKATGLQIRVRNVFFLFLNQNICIN